MTEEKFDDKNEYEDDDERMYITLSFDDGTDIETEALGIFESEGKEYIALIPDDGSDDVYIYGYKDGGDDSDEFELLDIDSEEEFQKAVAEFDRLMAAEEE